MKNLESQDMQNVQEAAGVQEPLNTSETQAKKGAKKSRDVSVRQKSGRKGPRKVKLEMGELAVDNVAELQGRASSVVSEAVFLDDYTDELEAKLGQLTEEIDGLSGILAKPHTSKKTQVSGGGGVPTGLGSSAGQTGPAKTGGAGGAGKPPESNGAPGNPEDSGEEEENAALKKLAEDIKKMKAEVEGLVEQKNTKELAEDFEKDLQQQKDLEKAYEDAYDAYAAKIVQEKQVEKKKNHYEVLGVTIDASEAAIRQAYDDIDVKSVEVMEAYNTLSNPFSRQEYDESMGLIDKSFEKILREGGEWVDNPDGSRQLLSKEELEERAQQKLKKKIERMESAKNVAKSAVTGAIKWSGFGLLGAGYLAYNLAKIPWQAAKTGWSLMGRIGNLLWEGRWQMGEGTTQKGDFKEPYEEIYNINMPKKDKKEENKKAA